MRERRQEDGRQQEDSGITSIPYGAENAHPIHAAAGGGYLGLGAFSVRNVPDQFQKRWAGRVRVLLRNTVLNFSWR